MGDFYKGMPAITVNAYGNGKAYYIAAELMVDGYTQLYRDWIARIVSSEKIVESPENVSITMRYSEDKKYVFILNFNNEKKKINLEFDYTVLSGCFEDEFINPYGVVVLEKV